MPEGPSIVIVKENIEFLVGKKVTAVAGNTKIDLHRMDGQQLQQILTWGKHLLLCFDGFTLRVHFMMFGTYRVNETKPTPPRLSLQFSSDELNFYTCSLLIIEEDINAVYKWSEDIMSGDWDAKAATRKLKQKGLIAADALLDQHLFSESGNIIKNEVLYRARIHPLSETVAMPLKKRKELVAETQKYAFQFLAWKKEFTLKKHWECYKQKTCKRCNLPFKRTHLGRGKRLTYLCENCQIKYD